MNQNKNWLDWAVELQALAQAGLFYSKDIYDIERFQRIREIATIKVLGFNSRETSDYVFREMFVLTGIGTVLGLPLGVLLHSFVMAQIDMDIVSFNVRISFWSFAASLVLTFAFACIVNIAMYFKLEKINMAESLKSIE
jgi:putative ABC transport system permease protein